MPRQVRLGRSTQCGDFVDVNERRLPVRAMDLEQVQRNEQHGNGDGVVDFPTIPLLYASEPTEWGATLPALTATTSEDSTDYDRR